MILVILPIIPSVLSVIGSSIIVSMVMSSKRITPYKRLLLGMSTCDIIMSSSVPFWSILLPRETSQRVWVIGNDATCTAIGFFAQFAFSAMLYNGMLTYYFLVTVRFGWKEEKTSKTIEPVMHAVSVGYPLLTASIGAYLGVYHEGELGPNCWVTDYPRNCGDDPHETGEACLGPLIAYIFGGIVMFFVLLSITVNNVVIFRYVRWTTTRFRRRSSYTLPTNDAQTQRIRAVAVQGFLYVGTFIFSYMWTMILKMIEGSSFDASKDSSLYPLLILQACFMPLQGFLNLIVYARPNYLRCRRDFPNETKPWCFRRAMYGDRVIPRSNNGGSGAAVNRHGEGTGAGHTNSAMAQSRRHSLGGSTAFFVPQSPSKQQRASVFSSTSLFLPPTNVRSSITITHDEACNAQGERENSSIGK